MCYNAPLFVLFWSEFNISNLARCESFNGVMEQWSGRLAQCRGCLKKKNTTRCHCQSFSEWRYLIVCIYAILDLQFLTPCHITRDHWKSLRQNVPESFFGENGKSAHLFLCEKEKAMPVGGAPRVMSLFMDRGYFVHQSTLDRIERKGARV